MSDQYVLINELKKSKNEDDRKKCILLIQEHLILSPNDVNAWYDLASCFDFCGFEKDAEPCYLKVYELGWQNLSAYDQASFFVGLGSTLRNNFKYSESIKFLDVGIIAFPNHSALKVFKALTLYSMNQFQDSTKILFETILQMPEKSFDGFDRAIKYYIENLETQKADT